MRSILHSRHRWPWVIVSACLLFSIALAQDETQKERSGSDSTADEAALRALTQEFYASYARKDLDGFLRLWSAKSPELASRRQAMQKFFTDYDKVELKSLTVRKVTLNGDQAKLRVEVGISAIEARTGKPTAGFLGMNRSLQFVKEDARWQVRRETAAEEDLAEALVSAKTEQERASLLAAEKELATMNLLRALVMQGERLRRQGNSPQALTIFHLAQSIAEQIGDREGIARTLSTLGLFHQSQGAYDLALEYFEKSLLVAGPLENKEVSAIAQFNIGFVHHSQGNYEQALEYYHKSLKIFEALENRERIANALNSIGAVQLTQGNYAQALERYQKSLAIYEASGNKEGGAIAQHNIGDLHVRQGNYAQALEYFQKSLTIFEASGNQAFIARALISIGLVHHSQGNYAQSLDCFKRSLTIFGTLGNQAGIARSLNSIGLVHESQGAHAQALESLQKSLALEEAMGNKEGIATALINIGAIYFAQGDYAQALERYQKSLTVSKYSGVKSNVAETLTAIGQTHRALNQLTLARQSFEEAIDVIETLRIQVAGGAQERQRFFEDKLASYQGMVVLLVAENQPGAALGYAERAKARVLLDVLHSGRVNITKALTTKEQEQERGFNNHLVSINTQISSENLRPQPDPARLDDLKAQLQKARLDYEGFQTGLYAAHPELKVQRGEAQPLTPEQAHHLLPDEQSALLEYVVADERTYLFVLTENPAGTTTELKVYPLEIKRKELGDRAARFRETLAKGSPGFRQPARELYDLLLKPAAAQLQGKTSLVIVPDGTLWELPFQALLTASNRYLIEDCAIAYAPSLTALREMIRLRDGKQDSAGYPTLLAFGNPALGKQTIARARSVLMDEKLDPLPEAERQVNVMRQIYGAAKSKIYIGAEAREERVKAEAGGYRILHLATHGILNDASPMYSHVLLTQAEGDANEDGLLEAWEIMKLDLKADLAVLSACETARGRVGAGEGMIGLSWALFVAGCPTAVVSHWKVESASTTELMLEFHRQLKSQMASAAGDFSSARALREAALKLQRMSAYRHPFYWAGFVVAGKGF
jgi:CHAT domain-containing protein/Tfp pilus assembly protein PilF